MLQVINDRITCSVVGAWREHKKYIKEHMDDEKK